MHENLQKLLAMELLEKNKGFANEKKIMPNELLK